MEPPDTDRIIGNWVLDQNDSAAYRGLGDASMEFLPDCRLVYRVLEGDRLQIILLTYRLDGAEIVTKQESDPREERSGYWIDATGRLSITSAGTRATFIRSTG